MSPSSRLSGAPPAPFLPLTWLAACVGFVFGATMVYVPYEFRAPLFQPVYPHIRALGAAFLASSLLLLGTAGFPRGSRPLEALGRPGLLVALGTYWWTTNVRPEAITGTVLYALMMVGLVLEALPPLRRRGVFREFVALSALAFGGLLLAQPARFSPVLYQGLAPWRWEAAALFLLGGAALLAPTRRLPRLHRVGFVLTALPFTLLAWVLGGARSWTGMEVYIVLVGGCLAGALGWRPQAPRSVGWRLVWGVAVAGIVPLLLLGGLAVYLAQQAVEAQVREDAVRASVRESELLVRSLADAQHSLVRLAGTPDLQDAVRTPARLGEALHRLETQALGFAVLEVVDAQGRLLATSDAGGHAPDLPAVALPPLSTGVLPAPFLLAGDRPGVGLAVPLRSGRETLLGVLPIERLAPVPAVVSRRFRTLVVDRRDLRVVRDSLPTAGPLAPDTLPAEVRHALAQATPQVRETFMAGDTRMLVAAVPVPGSDWSVVVTRDLGQAYAAVTRMSLAVLGLLVLGAGLAVALSRLVARDVLRRLRGLQEATTALAAGELGRRVEVGSEEDELSALAHAFNEMATRTGAAQEELRAAVRMREEFLSVASHELRTPLTPLRGLAGLTLARMEQEPPSPSRERYLKALRSMARQTDRLTRLVEELLDTSRLQAGRFELERAEADLREVVREVLERFELRGEERLRFVAELPEAPVKGVWDAARLDQVVTNLVSNAVRYSPQGGTVHVSLKAAGDEVVLQVRDEGIGLPPECIATLFQPFVRASNATARAYGGLGLGLFICREIVERHGGTIRAESEGPGRGSCFTVRLPRAAAEAAA